MEKVSPLRPHQRSAGHVNTLAWRAGIATVCAVALLALGYVASDKHSSGGASRVALAEVMSRKPTTTLHLQTAAQIHQLAVQQGRAQALAEKEAEAKAAKAEGATAAAPAEKQPLVVPLPKDENAIREAAIEGKKLEADDIKTASQVVVTSSAMDKQFAEEKREIQQRDSAWRQRVEEERGHETHHYERPVSDDHIRTDNADHVDAAEVKEAVAQVEKHLSKQVAAITSTKEDKAIIAKAAAAEKDEEKHIQDQIASITGSSSDEEAHATHEEQHHIAPHMEEEHREVRHEEDAHAEPKKADEQHAAVQKDHEAPKAENPKDIAFKKFQEKMAKRMAEQDAYNHRFDPKAGVHKRVAARVVSHSTVRP